MPKWSGVTLEVEGTRADVVTSLSEVAVVGRRVRVSGDDGTSVTIEDWWRPAWGLKNGVFRFPFGLLALLYLRHTRLVINVRAVAYDRTELVLDGSASRNVNNAVWSVLGELLADETGSGPIEAASLNRWDEIGRNVRQWARSNPWTFSIGIGLLVFVVASWSSTWDVLTDEVGNAIFSILIVAFAARRLGLWPTNRVIHWRTSRLPRTQ